MPVALFGIQALRVAGQVLGGWVGRPGVLGALWRGAVHLGDCSLPRGALRTWAGAPPLHMAAKVDLTTSTDWKEAKKYLSGLSQKQRREHYFTKDFLPLKSIDTWKKMAKNAHVKQPEGAKFPKDAALNEKISLLRHDITKLEVDAIVNAVDGCIHRAAGELLKEECRSLSGCETGEAKITCGYRLPALWVIHTVGPVCQGPPGPTQEAALRSCYSNSLHVAQDAQLHSVAFPCISTGVFGYPSEAAAEVALGTLREWLQEHKDKVERLVLCVFLEKDEAIYKEKLPLYFPVGDSVDAAALD
ncbi:ADP-ribose glycohydrolase MACROD1 isoform X3 [Alligator mississippiensis]|uniref:ADP-ribose glycohydrolase MACROD1 isoform X3 n=1 Tax=Alligator mississippiensis TaxID=8496 RepID=UPI002877D9F5|nr:ADP-ribose glycohydrolase MACROD1 isoform X3 [Alligator mississippiensis]